ncbi:MAG: vitamin K epoxide reductase family protein [Actinomycetes bacterium]
MNPDVAPPENAADPGESPRSQSRVPYWWILLAAVVGIAATLIQSYERLQLALHPNQVLLCDINGALSCSSVLESWQARAFGLPNSWIGLAVFSLFASAAVAGVTGSVLSRGYLGFLGFFSAFMLLFTLWFLWQSAFAIGALCLYCVLIGTAVVITNAAVWRLWRREQMLPSPLAVLVDSRLDLVFWFALWAAVGIGMAVGLSSR